MQWDGASGLVGRSRESAILTAAFDDAIAGRGGVTLVVGEPGIGKTSLANAFSDWAVGRGGKVCWGRAWEAGGAPAFWPWIEVLREIASDGALLADLPGLVDLATLLPELREQFPQLPAAPIVEPAQARFRLFDAVAALLRRASGRGPIAIVLDDLHAADVPSLELLRFLARGARRMPLVVLGTYRDVEARLSATAGSVLAKIERDAQVVRLARLAPEDVATLVARETGQAPAPELVRRLAGATEGNPLFVVETLRLLRAQGSLGDARTLPVAGGVREVILERLAVLPADVRALVDAACVLGREVDPTLLEASAERPLAALGGALALLHSLDVLMTRDDGRLAFTHILLCEVPYRALAAERRARLHLRVAEALERRVGAGATEQVAELAHHFFEAAPVGGVERAIGYAERAARRAMELVAFEDAVPLLERALQALGTEGDDARRCDLLLALGEARIRAGSDRKGQEACAEATTIARRTGDKERLARAALTYGEVFTFAFVDPLGIALLEEALAARGPGDSPMTARLLARLASALQPARDPLPPMEIARDAIAMARRVGDETCLLGVLHAANSAFGYFEEPARRAVLNAEQVALGTRLGDKMRTLRAHRRLVVDFLELGDLARADAAILEYERQAREIRLPAVSWYAPILRAMRTAFEGRFDEAEEHEAEARALAGMVSDSNATVSLTMFRGGLYRAAARHEELAAFLPTIRELVFRHTDELFSRSIMASMEARLEHTASTRAELARLTPDLGAYEHRGMLTFVAEAIVFVGDHDAGAHAYRMLEKFDHRNHSWGIGSMVCEGPIVGIRAALAAMLGESDVGDRLFDVAIRRCDEMGALPFSARTRYEWARAIERRGQGDAAHARKLVDEARALADTLELAGLRGPLEALGASLAQTRAPLPPPSPSPSAPPAAAPGGGTLAMPPAPAFTLALDGEVWAVTCEGKVLRLRDSKGLQILAHLVAHPGQEFHVTDLLAPGGAGGGTPGLVEDAGEMIDREAAAQYRQRARDLQEELREAEEWGDAGRTERLREEIDFLAKELSRGLGLGGRSRKASSTAEKARVNVQRRLKDAISRIAEQHPPLGEHLEWSIRTGTFCQYRGGPAGPS